MLCRVSGGSVVFESAANPTAQCLFESGISPLGNSRNSPGAATSMLSSTDTPRPPIQMHEEAGRKGR